MSTEDTPGLRIDCSEVVELVAAYLEGAVDGETAAEIEGLLDLCEAATPMSSRCAARSPSWVTCRSTASTTRLG